MKILLQRVTSAEVTVDGKSTGKIAKGALLFVSFGAEDSAHPNFPRAAEKISQLRIFPDAHGKLMHSLIDCNYAALAVPQFTLHAHTAKGRRPDFSGALPPAPARAHFDAFVRALRQTEIAQVECGVFGADMRVDIANDGPFTLLIEM